MAVSYNKLWKLLVDKKMSKSDLRKKAEIAPNTMTRLRRDEEVSLSILSKICKTLNADFGDIVEYVPDAEIWDLYNENRELLGKDHGPCYPFPRHFIEEIERKGSSGVTVYTWFPVLEISGKG